MFLASPRHHIFRHHLTLSDKLQLERKLSVRYIWFSTMYENARLTIEQKGLVISQSTTARTRMLKNRSDNHRLSWVTAVTQICGIRLTPTCAQAATTSQKNNVWVFQTQQYRYNTRTCWPVALLRLTQNLTSTLQLASDARNDPHHYEKLRVQSDVVEETLWSCVWRTTYKRQQAQSPKHDKRNIYNT